MEYLEITFNKEIMKAKGKMKTIYLAGMILIPALFPLSGAAGDQQGPSATPVSIELLKAKSLWFGTSNGAGITLDKMTDFNNLLFGYDLASGDFKKKSDGSDERNIGVSTEGGLNLGGGYVWGSFAYNNTKQTGTVFNTTMLDPGRGMPFYTIDANLSDWFKQDYNLSMKASTHPFGDKLYLGIQAGYHTKTGAKQVDPRSKVDFYTLDVKPGVVLKLNNHSAGINFFYEKLNQESSTTNSNNQANQNVFVMKGLGNFYRAVVGGLQSLGKFVYNGNATGGAIQYAYEGSSMHLMLNGGYIFGVEDVISTPTKPKKEGSIKKNIYDANLQILFTGDNLHKAGLSWANRKNSGIEYVQVLDNTFEVQRWITTYKSIRSTFDLNELSFRYDFFRGNDFEYKWRTGLSVNYRNSEDLYIIPVSEMNLEEVIFGVDAKVNLNLKKAGKILAGMDLGYKTNLDGNYQYGGADPGSPVITGFMKPDFQYLQTDYMKIGGELSYFTGIGKTRHAGMFVKAAVSCFLPGEGENNRMLTGFGIGFTF